ncbi:alpha,alpha-trehalose-phosphate synthase, glycosyltransferase family 20 protein [Rhodotorula toruloides]|uniref:alpha,alpha-trehalose-phosphate synthase (UDP-forming) n=1 Tax=Rhodotorula toruloides TaxID=5286 RepID=A0A511KQV8_RHOTO|nr:alpha,alpha-trehalose-phosphate synthase, glycosyltransferase family 20 protein [Rhodotorula toruloides]
MARDNDSTGPTRLARQRSTSSEIHQSRLSSSGQLIVVANRLPVTITADKDAPGGYRFSVSSGGLASALAGAKKKMDFVWIGWPGFDVPEIDREFITKKLQTDFSCIPVYLSAEVAERFYNGFSNSILWPFFHYHPGEIQFDETDWLAYRQANLLFAEAVQKEVNSGDIVWVQDYHLCLVPVFLRDLLGRDPASMGEHGQRDVNAMFEGLTLGPQAASKPGSNTPAGINGTHGTNYVGDVQIGYFLHTPFPSSEVFRTLPVRREILLGILNCDLIGFHTYDYARHFISSCSRLLGLKCTPNRIELVGRHASVGTFPIGIEPSQFDESLEKEEVQQRISTLRRRFEGVKLIVGVDRLDYIKGVPQKLHAMEVFLEEHPEWIGKVVLVQVAVPSRQDVEEYQNLRASVNELVGRINGRFGTIDWMPIHFMHRSVPFSELTALYTVSDACLITSTRDGMNLVAYEYIACQRDNHGVLILSEFAGAAHSLNGSLIVNPWNTAETGEAIHQALTMPRDEREENHRKLYRYVSQYTASHWGTEFVAELQRDRAERRAIAEGKEGDESAQAAQLRRQGLQLTGKA